MTVLFAVPGGMELVVILAVVILLFGSSKIPQLARSVGTSIGEFQKGREEIEQELDEATTTEKSEATSDNTN